MLGDQLAEIRKVIASEIDDIGQYGVEMPSTDRQFYRVNVTPGERYTLECGYSEAACHLRRAGTTVQVEVLPDSPNMAQLYEEGTGAPISFPITTGEAGLYWDQGLQCHYYYDRTAA